MKSAIYRGNIRHRRLAPTRHTFSYRLFMMYLDLAELPRLFDSHWLWSARRAAPAWFRRSDYLGSEGVALDTAVRDEAERLTGTRPDGPVRLLTHLRYFGYIMNPVSFYYCFSRNERVETILAEITNTPWKERHVYAVRASSNRAATDTTHRFGKEFHISPFMPMDQEYSWRFTDPGERLSVHMENHHEGTKLFDASLTLERHAISSRSLAAVLATYPFMTLKVLAGIYGQALRLRLKKTPYHPHPASPNPS